MPALPVGHAPHSESFTDDALPAYTYVQEAESEYEDSHSAEDEEPSFRLPAKLREALADAAEVTSRYFEEGVVSASGYVAPPPSAAGDFRSKPKKTQTFRFLESPSVSYELLKILAAKQSGTAGGSTFGTVPLFAAHGQAPDAAKPWLATDQLSSHRA